MKHLQGLRLSGFRRPVYQSGRDSVVHQELVASARGKYRVIVLGQQLAGTQELDFLLGIARGYQDILAWHGIAY